MSTVNETLIRDVVSEVLGRLGGAASPKTSAPASPPKSDCGCNGRSHIATPGLRGRFGVFTDADEACVARDGQTLSVEKLGRRQREALSRAIEYRQLGFELPLGDKLVIRLGTTDAHE